MKTTTTTILTLLMAMIMSTAVFAQTAAAPVAQTPQQVLAVLSRIAENSQDTSRNERVLDAFTAYDQVFVTKARTATATEAQTHWDALKKEVDQCEGFTKMAPKDLAAKAKISEADAQVHIAHAKEDLTALRAAQEAFRQLSGLQAPAAVRKFSVGPAPLKGGPVQSAPTPAQQQAQPPAAPAQPAPAGAKTKAEEARKALADLRAKRPAPPRPSGAIP